MIPSPLPHGRTARRLEWTFLPPHVRALVARRCGAPVVEAESRTDGFTPGFASVLTCADGSRHFVKAASVKAQRAYAEAYREEARRLALVPGDVPAPRLLWTDDDDDWVVLGIEHVAARAPGRPWAPDDLDRTLDALEDVAEALTPAPPDLAPTSFAEDCADWPARWDDVAQDPPPLPGLADHLDEAAVLAAGFGPVCTGDTVVHGDVRDDNVLLAPDGRTMVCGWGWPTRGAAWLDSLVALLGPRGDGLDVEAVVRERRLLSTVPPEHLDAVLALLVGHFLVSSTRPVPPTSPHLRPGQRWHGEVAWDWLAERRGWS